MVCSTTPGWFSIARRWNPNQELTVRYWPVAVGGHGQLCLGIFSLARGCIATSLVGIPAQPWWSLLGGLLGASALLSYAVLAPKIGLSALLGLAIAGQITSSLVIDHLGLLGAVERPVSLIKLGGTMVMLTGLAIALFGDRWSSLVPSGVPPLSLCFEYHLRKHQPTANS